KLPSGPSGGNDKRTENQRGSASPAICDQNSMSSSRTQQMYAFNWIRNHLEEHPETSLPKQEVYDEYKSYCDNLGYHPLSAADFGKIMKNVFPNMKARRLGMRGKSKYPFVGLRKKAFVHVPSLPNLDLHKSGDGCELLDSTGQSPSAEDEMRSAACGLVCEWAQKVLSRQFDSVDELARFLLNSHYIGTKSMAALTVMTGTPTGMKTPTPASAFVPTGEANSFQPQVKTLPSPSVDAKQQLQRKIQKKQQEQKLTSPLPTDAQARRAEAGTPGPGSSLTTGSPAILSPQPTIGIVVTAVPSPITVQRNRQLMTSPSPVGAAEGKVVPVNFQVVTQPVKQSPKTPQNFPASPVGDRLARHRYAQILPKPSATSAIALRSPPTLLITNSPIKTVMPTPHVSSLNVVKMTAISLAPSSSSSSSSTPTPLRPASTGFSSTASLEESCQIQQAQNGASVMSLQSSGKAGRPSTTPTPSASIVTSEVKVTFEAVNDSNSATAVYKQITASGASTGLKNERATKFRASSEPSFLIKASPVPERVTRAKSDSTTPSSTIMGALAPSSNNNNDQPESTLYLTVTSQNVDAELSSICAMATASTSSKDASLGPKSPRKRSASVLETHTIPVKRVFISQQPLDVGYNAKPGIVIAAKKIQRPGTPARPESAPCKVTLKQSSSLPTQILALSDTPIGALDTSQMVNPQNEVADISPSETASANSTALLQQIQSHQQISSDLCQQVSTVSELKSSLQDYSQQMQAEHKQIAANPLSLMAQATETTSQLQSRHQDGNLGRLTTISPVQQGQQTTLSSKQESFAVPAPLDNKGAGSTSTSGGGTFRCRSVSPAVRQRNLSGTTAQTVTTPRSVVSPFNCPLTFEVLNILSNNQSGVSASSLAQRSQSVPLNIMMQSELLPISHQGQQSNSAKITTVLLSKMDTDGDDAVRGLGVNNLPANYTARMNLTQILETTQGFPGGPNFQNQQLPLDSSPSPFDFQKTGYLISAGEEQVTFSSGDSQAQSGSGLQRPEEQLQLQEPQLELQDQQLQLQNQQLQLPDQQLQLRDQQLQLQDTQLQLQDQQLQLPDQQQLQDDPDLTQHHLLPQTSQQVVDQEQQEQLDFNTTVKDLLGEDSLNPSSQLVGQVASELSAVASDFSSDIRLTSDLSSSINDLNTLDPNLLFDPSQQQDQFEDATLEELKNDPLFQQICSDTVNSAGFDWLENKDQPTVEMLG
uniref:DNA-binding protein RFX7-like n=1 Tax=Sinocyclocheilus anshuiensis TaxID=1608454 RepID=A0A671LQT2_9TELE